MGSFHFWQNQGASTKKARKRLQGRMLLRGLNCDLSNWGFLGILSLSRQLAIVQPVWRSPWSWRYQRISGSASVITVSRPQWLWSASGGSSLNTLRTSFLLVWTACSLPRGNPSREDAVELVLHTALTPLQQPNGLQQDAICRLQFHI